MVDNELRRRISALFVAMRSSCPLYKSAVVHRQNLMQKVIKPFYECPQKKFQSLSQNNLQ
jgi:hypothetical protein